MIWIHWLKWYFFRTNTKTNSANEIIKVAYLLWKPTCISTIEADVPRKITTKNHIRWTTTAAGDLPRTRTTVGGLLCTILCCLPHGRPPAAGLFRAGGFSWWSRAARRLSQKGCYFLLFCSWVLVLLLKKMINEAKTVWYLATGSTGPSPDKFSTGLAHTAADAYQAASRLSC